MKISQITLLSTSSTSSNQFLSGISKRFKKPFMSLIDPKNIIKSFGMTILDSNSIATKLVKSRLARISEVVDFDCRQNNKSVELFAYLNEPNEEAERKIYEIYSDLLELSPSSNIDIKIVELYGRSKEEIQPLSL